MAELSGVILNSGKEKTQNVSNALQPERKDRIIDQQRLNKAKDELIVTGGSSSPRKVDRALTSSSGVYTKKQEVVNYVLASTTQPIPEVFIDNPQEFSLSETLGSIYEQVSGTQRTFLNDSAGLGQFEQAIKGRSFIVSLRVNPNMPQDASSSSDPLRQFAAELRVLPKSEPGIKVIAFSENVGAIPTEISRELVPV